MWEDYDGDFVREDALVKLKNAVEGDAKDCGFEVRLLGGLLKFTPIGVYSIVLLELEQPNFSNNTVIYKHKNAKLTSEYKGKPVSKKWVVGFLKHNANEAKRLISEKKKSDEQKEQSRVNEKPQIPKPPPAPSKSEEEMNYGYSTAKSICPVCNGDGGAAGQCYKCGGSGWA